MRRSTLGAAFAVLCAVASAQTAALVPSHDNTLFEDPNGALSNGAGPHFYVGRVGFSGGQLLRRGLLRFDVASV
ncbi:MAG TPA: hypothetical protein VEI02_00225, partial [Planctomycetota bacterium]|nr:hypothetical protein [Planctomycetota bacterium]